MTKKNNFPKFSLFVYLFLFFLAGSASGSTIFVSSTGDDTTGSGDDNAPFYSIGYALEVAQFGDTISINDGIYNEGQLVLPPGVSLTSTSRDKSKVKLLPGNSISGAFIQVSSSSPGSEGNQSISHLTISGTNNYYKAKIGILVRNRNNVTVDNCNIYNFTGSNGCYGIYAYSNQIEPTSNVQIFIPHDMQRPGTDSNLDALWPANPIENFQLSNCFISNCGYRASLSTGGIYSSVYLFNVKNSSIYNNIIDSTESRAECIYATCAFLWNVDIYNNRLSMPKYTDRSSYSIELWMLRNGCEVYNNTANASFSITYGKETYIFNNSIVVADNKGGLGIEFTGQSYGTLDNNFLSGTSYGLVVGLSNIQQDKNYIVTDVFVRRNIIYNVTKSGIYLESNGSHITSKTNTVQNIYIYNNTINTNRSNAGYSLVRLEQSDGKTGFGRMKNVEIINNVLINSNPVDYAGKTIGTIDNLVIDNNLFYNNGHNDWLSHVDTNTHYFKPEFSSSLDKYSGYKPVDGTDLVDTGINVGLSYAGNAPDLGAIESSSSNSTFSDSNIISNPQDVVAEVESPMAPSGLRIIPQD